MHHYKEIFTWEAAVRGGWAAGGALGYVASRLNLQNPVCTPKMRTLIFIHLKFTLKFTLKFASWVRTQQGCQGCDFYANV